jgi:SAM-dependent methyltransferase
MSRKWSLGYSSDVAYILGFYRELAPSFLDYVCAINGVPGVPWSKPLRYCELGCGRGFGTTLLAAANPDITFVGIDFNPTHIAEAKAFADRLNLPNLTFRELSFGEASRSSERELSEFDIIAMHGVYSWVMPSVREEIHEFIRSKLVPAGIFFVSYNTMPGWAVVAPIQRLLQEIANRSSGDSLTLFGKGYEVLQTLAEKSSAFVVQNPALKNRIDRMKKQNKRYLAHEFLNVGWQPLYVTDVIAMLAEAKLAYVGSATIAENRLELSVPREFQPVVGAAADVSMRELLQDYVVNKHFRRDVYVKGPLELSAQEKRQQLENMTFAYVDIEKAVPDKLRVPAGEAKPSRLMIDTVLQRLANGPATASELIKALETTPGGSAGVFRLLEILVHHSIIHPARPNHDAIDRTPSHLLNKATLALAASGNTHHYLASPVLGSAIACGYFDRLVAPLVWDGVQKNDELVAEDVLRLLSAAGFRLEKDGEPVEDELETLAKHTSEFREVRLPHWRALGLIPAALGPEQAMPPRCRGSDKS